MWVRPPWVRIPPSPQRCESLLEDAIEDGTGRTLPGSIPTAPLSLVGSKCPGFQFPQRRVRPSGGQLVSNASAGVKARGFDSSTLRNFSNPRGCSPTAEAAVSNTVQCGFESHHPYLATSSAAILHIGTRNVKARVPKMKAEKKRKAILLRKQGKSVRQITQELGVSKSSVSRWVRNVEMTPELKALLQSRNPATTGHIAGPEAIRKKHEAFRQKWRDQGRQDALRKDWIHIAGCMLYWGEGTKNRNTCAMTNSDPDMLRLFVKFLHYMGVPNSKIRLSLSVYTDILTVEECEKFWVQYLGLPVESLQKTQVNKVSKASKGKRQRKLKYGTAKIRVDSTELVQRIYGSLQEYGHMKVPAE